MLPVSLVGDRGLSVISVRSSGLGLVGVLSVGGSRCRGEAEDESRSPLSPVPAIPIVLFATASSEVVARRFWEGVAA